MKSCHLFLSAWLLFAATAFADPITVAPLDAQARARLAKTLEPLHTQYDPAEKMIRRPFSSPGYHTTLKGGDVHPTRDSLRYARAILDLGDPAMDRRAFDILERVIGLQDQNPASKTYGIWSWFMDEPLEKMSPPDWNWADFCGRELLQVILCHGHRLPADLKPKIDASIIHAARSIQKRNVGPAYTNIAVLGTYVTLIAGETYNDAGLKTYGIARLKRIVDYTAEQGAFTEYNSPTYTLVTMKALAGLVSHAQDESAGRMARELYRKTWEELAQHWHAPTQQWAGPHSRCYSTLVGEGVRSLIQRGTAGRVALGADLEKLDVDEYRCPIMCPADMEPLLAKLEGPRTVVETFIKGAKRSTIGATYLHPDFALGTVNRGSFWNQARPVVAYYGDAKRPGYMQVRLLKNGYDLSAGRVYTAQDAGRCLSAITLATDGGDTHPSLDKLKDGVLKAKDLRLRFEFGGSGADAKITPPQNLTGAAEVQLGKLKLHVVVPVTRFADSTPRWETTMPKDAVALDLVLYAGPERDFKLADIATALVVAIGFQEMPPGITVDERDGKVYADWAGLKVTASGRPMKAAELDEK